MRLLLLCGCALPVLAATSTSWEMTSYQDFVKARFKNVALSREGRITVAPKLDVPFSSDQPVVWAVAAAPNRDIYVATGHRGRLYRVSANGQSQLVFTAPEPEIFAMAIGANGQVYAATSPNGKVYRINGTQATVYFDPKARYIWSLAVAADGTLFAGTGDSGKVFRVTGPNAGEVWFDSGQTHITSLALDTQKRLLAGSEPNGLLYRITGKEQAFVLYDANFPEIRSILAAPDGTIYTAAMGGSVAKQSQSQSGNTPSVTSSVTVTAPATSITVTDEPGAAAAANPVQNPPGIDIKPKQQQQPQSATASTTTTAATATPIVEYAGTEKSAIYRILPDNTVETLWTSREENAYDLALEGSKLLFGTDQQGRVYRLDADRQPTLLTETGENQILRLAPSTDGLLLATGDLGKLFRLSGSAATTGEVESPVHDATTVARWGRLSWIGSGPIRFRTRSGNSARPDKTWSPWSDPITGTDGAPVVSPNARYAQWKAELSASAVLHSVRVAYLPQNTPPILKSITVSAQTSSAGSKLATATATPALPTYSITVTDTGESGASSVSGTASQPVTRASQEQLLISWVSEDLDNDKLIYTLQFRGEDESDWKLLKANVTETNYTIDAEALADGRYFFRVAVSDRLSNPAQHARTGELISAPILIDRTPPQLKVTSQAPQVQFTAADSASPLKSCEYSIDASPWTPVSPVDGVLDSMQEEFALQLPATAGEHLVVFRCYDSANNAGLAKIVVR